MNNVFLLTGISNKNPTGTGISVPKFQVGNGIGTLPSGPSLKWLPAAFGKRTIYDFGWTKTITH
jgi:hypothetical protein